MDLNWVCPNEEPPCEPGAEPDQGLARSLHALEPLMYLQGSDRPLSLGEEIGRGGEGCICTVQALPSRAAKVYFELTRERHEKLEAMLRNPPREPGDSLRHVSICWPVDLLFKEQNYYGAHGRLLAAGFLMHRVDRSSHFSLNEIYNPTSRRSLAPGMDWRLLVRCAINLAAVLESLHASGYVAGDVSETNILVSPQALVTLVDCDSMQVPAAGGGYHRCTVGRADFLPPELQHGRYAEVDRNATQDCFGLAILIFHLLMEGWHPFSCSWEGTGDEHAAPAQLIASRQCPFITRGDNKLVPPPSAPRFESLPPPLQALFQRCFVAGLSAPEKRPTASEWRETLKAVEESLVSCRRNPRHVHSPDLQACPWCERTALLGGWDPFPAPGGQQALTKAGGVSRAPVEPSGSRMGFVPVWRPAGPGAGQPAAMPPAAPAQPGWLAQLWRHRPWAVLAAGIGVLALGVFGGYLACPVSPQEELRRQNVTLAQLTKEGRLVKLEDYQKNAGLRDTLSGREGVKTHAIERFSAVRPLWVSNELNCEVTKDTALSVKAYVDNEGYFAASHYSAAVVPADRACGNGHVILAPMSALPPSLRLLDCPGRGGRLQGFAWHSNEEWSCAPLPGKPAPPAKPGNESGYL